MHTHAQFYQSYVRVTYAVEFVEFVMICMCRCVSVSWPDRGGGLYMNVSSPCILHTRTYTTSTALVTHKGACL